MDVTIYLEMASLIMTVPTFVNRAPGKHQAHLISKHPLAALNPGMSWN